MVKIPGFAQDYVQDFIKQVGCSPNIQRKALKKWCPPNSDLVKINFNGAMFNKRDETSIGVIIRNLKGEVMAALSEKIKKSPIVEILELLATKRVVRFSLEMSFNKSFIEGDSKSVIRSLRYGGFENSQDGHLIKDILFSVNSFQGIYFSHVV